MLCLDNKSRIVIVEVKINKDKKQLFQALKYCIEIKKSMKYFPEIFKDKIIKLEKSPRIILVAKEFSKIMRNISLLIKFKINFYKYQISQNQSKKKTIIFEKMESPVLETYYPLLYNIKQHIERIKIRDIKDYCINLINEIKKIDSFLRVYAIKHKINIKHLKSQRIISYIETYQKSFRIFAYNFEKREDGNYYHYGTKTNISVKKATQNLIPILERLKKSIEFLNRKEDNIDT